MSVPLLTLLQDRNNSWWYKVLAGFFAYPLWFSFINRGLLWGVNDADSILLWYVARLRFSRIAVLICRVLGRLLRRNLLDLVLFLQ